MLNFDEQGIPIAMVKGSKDDLDGEIVYYSDHQRHKKRKMIYESSDSESDDEDDEKYIGLEEGHFIPLPREDKRETILIAGRSGSGKSTWAAQYCKNYKLMFPDREIFIFSRGDPRNDPAFNGLGILPIEISEKILTTPIDFEKEIKKECIIVFDDITTIQDNKLKKCVEKLLCDGLEFLRKKGVTILFCNHLLIDNDRGLARTVINEIDKLVVFPGSGSPQQIKYVLTKYFEFTDKQCRKMLKTTSRWICFSKENSKLVLSEYECYIPDNL